MVGSFGRRLAEAVVAAGISYRELDRLAEPPTTPGHAGKAAREVMAPGGGFVARWALVLGCSSDWLISGIGRPAGAKKAALAVAAARQVAALRPPAKKRTRRRVRPVTRPAR